MAAVIVEVFEHSCSDYILSMLECRRSYECPDRMAATATTARFLPFLNPGDDKHQLTAFSGIILDCLEKLCVLLYLVNTNNVIHYQPDRSTDSCYLDANDDEYRLDPTARSERWETKSLRRGGGSPQGCESWPRPKGYSLQRAR